MQTLLFINNILSILIGICLGVIFIDIKEKLNYYLWPVYVVWLSCLFIDVMILATLSAELSFSVLKF